MLFCAALVGSVCCFASSNLPRCCAVFSLASHSLLLFVLLYRLTGLPPFYNQNLHVMYEKIIRAKLHYPAYLSAPARSILQQLLDRNPKTRLGSNGDAAEVKVRE